MDSTIALKTGSLELSLRLEAAAVLGARQRGTTTCKTSCTCNCTKTNCSKGNEQTEVVLGDDFVVDDLLALVTTSRAESETF